MPKPTAKEKRERAPFYWHADPIGCLPSFLSVNSREPVLHNGSRDPRSYDEMARVFHSVFTQPSHEGVSFRWRDTLDPFRRSFAVLDLTAHATVPFSALRGGQDMAAAARSVAVGLESDGNKVIFPRIGWLSALIGDGAAFMSLDKCSVVLGYARRDHGVAGAGPGHTGAGTSSSASSTVPVHPTPVSQAAGVGASASASMASSPASAGAMQRVPFRTLDSAAIRFNYGDSTVSCAATTILPIGMNHAGPELLRLGGSRLGMWSAGVMAQWAAPWKPSRDPFVPLAVQWRVRGSLGGGPADGTPSSSLLIQGDGDGNLGIHALTNLTPCITIGTSHSFGGSRDAALGRGSILGAGTRVALLVSIPEGNLLESATWRARDGKRASGAAGGGGSGIRGALPTTDPWTRAAECGEREPVRVALRRAAATGAADGAIATEDNRSRRPYIRLTAGCGETAATAVVPIGRGTTSIGGTVRVSDEGAIKVGLAVTAEHYVRR
jgi:hypothetical protein